MQSEERPAPVMLDYAAERRPARWRTYTAIALAAIGGLAAGFALSFAGFGFFPAWLFLTFACPVVVCLVTASRHVLVAMLFAGAMMGLELFRVLLPPSGGYPMNAAERRGVIGLMTALAAFSLLVAGWIGAAFAARRRSV